VSERPSSRARVLFSFSLLSHPPYSLVFDNQPPFKLQHETKITYAFQSQSFPSSLPLAFIVPFFYISRLALSESDSDNTVTYRHKAATMRQPYVLPFLYYFRPPFMLTFSLYPIPITDTPEIATTVQNQDTAERKRAFSR
jgi:hypothetical protein